MIKLKQRFRTFLDANKSWRSHLLLLFLLFIPIILIFTFDALNVEGFDPFNQKFMFDLTWKGRMFYLVFAWLLIIEFILNWEVIKKQGTFTVQHYYRIFFCVLIPITYIVSVNFLGLNQIILDFGELLQIRTEPPDFLYEHWPLSFEYLLLFVFFILLLWLAYGRVGLKRHSLSLSLLGGIVAVYLLDTLYPFGTLRLVQLFTIPTAAFATALLDLLGYGVTLSYEGVTPIISVILKENFVSAEIAWPCAGVHSLFLFILIALVIFKQTKWQRDRKIIYFLFGIIGTYVTNILRVASFFIISINYGEVAGQVFHNSYGELFFIAWIFLYIIVMFVIESGKMNGFIQFVRR